MIAATRFRWNPEVFALHCLAGYEIREVATMLGITPPPRASTCATPASTPRWRCGHRRHQGDPADGRHLMNNALTPFAAASADVTEICSSCAPRAPPSPANAHPPSRPAWPASQAAAHHRGLLTEDAALTGERATLPPDRTARETRVSQADDDPDMTITWPPPPPRLGVAGSISLPSAHNTSRHSPQQRSSW